MKKLKTGILALIVGGLFLGYSPPEKYYRVTVNVRLNTGPNTYVTYTVNARDTYSAKQIATKMALREVSVKVRSVEELKPKR